MNAAATKIQKMWKGLLARRRYAEIRRAALALQCAVRTVLAQRMLVLLRRLKAAIQIQSVARMYRERKRFVKLKETAIVLQSGTCYECVYLGKFSKPTSTDFGVLSMMIFYAKFCDIWLGKTGKVKKEITSD